MEQSQESSNVSAWKIPEVFPKHAAPKEPTAEEISAIRSKAHQDGHAQGYREGLAQAQQEMEMLKRQVESLTLWFENPIKTSMSEQEKKIVGLTEKICSVLLRKEYQADPSLLVPVIQEAVNILEEEKFRLHLSSSDFQVFQAGLFSEIAPQFSSFHFVSDPRLLPGDFRLETSDRGIDGSLEHRLELCIRHMLSGEKT